MPSRTWISHTVPCSPESIRSLLRDRGELLSKIQSDTHTRIEFVAGPALCILGETVEAVQAALPPLSLVVEEEAKLPVSDMKVLDKRGEVRGMNILPSSPSPPPRASTLPSCSKGVNAVQDEAEAIVDFGTPMQDGGDRSAPLTVYTAVVIEEPCGEGVDGPTTDSHSGGRGRGGDDYADGDCANGHIRRPSPHHQLQQPASSSLYREEVPQLAAHSSSCSTQSSSSPTASASRTNRDAVNEDAAGPATRRRRQQRGGEGTVTGRSSSSPPDPFSGPQPVEGSKCCTIS